MRGIARELGIVVIGFLSACGGGGSGDAVEVLQGDDALQAAAEAAIGISGALQVLLGDVEDGPSVRASRTSSVPTSGASTRASRALRVACPLGGSVDGECRESGGRTVVATNSADCTLFDEDLGLTIVANGRADATYEATGICGRSVPVGVASTSRLRGYVEEWWDGDKLVRVSESSRLEVESHPAGGGCSANEGQTSIHGDLRVRGEGFDVGMILSRLEVDVTSEGNPCESSVTAVGGIEVDDRARGARFAGTTRGLRFMTRRALDGILEVSLDGMLDFDCLGEVRVTTAERLALGAACPFEGELGVSIDGGGSATARFTRDGLALDYLGDGTIDLESASCGAETMSVCM